MSLHSITFSVVSPDPTNEQLAEESGLTTEKVIECKDILEYEGVSLSIEGVELAVDSARVELWGRDEPHPPEGLLRDVRDALHRMETQFENGDVKVAIIEAVFGLEDHMGEQETLGEVALRLGMTAKEAYDIYIQTKIELAGMEELNRGRKFWEPGSLYTAGLSSGERAGQKRRGKLSATERREQRQKMKGKYAPPGRERNDWKAMTGVYEEDKFMLEDAQQFLAQFGITDEEVEEVVEEVKEKTDPTPKTKEKKKAEREPEKKPEKKSKPKVAPKESEAPRVPPAKRRRAKRRKPQKKRSK
jgi:hypothetical protein